MHVARGAARRWISCTTFGLDDLRYPSLDRLYNDDRHRFCLHLHLWSEQLVSAWPQLRLSGAFRYMPAFIKEGQPREPLE